MTISFGEGKNINLIVILAFLMSSITITQDIDVDIKNCTGVDINHGASCCSSAVKLEGTPQMLS